MSKLQAVIIAAMMAAPTCVNAQCGLVGFANYRDLGLQGTTGGMGGSIVHVTNREDFAKYAAASEPYIIILDADLKGFYDYSTTPKQKHDQIKVTSNKTIIGGGSGARLDSLGLEINGQQNIIVRNLKISKADPDGFTIKDSHHIWIDHCDLSSQKDENDANDGLLDFTYGSSYMTVSWCKFHDHDKSSICSSGSRNITDHGKQRVTYHHTSFINTTQRNPRIGYGLGHIFNNYNEKNTSYAIGMFGRVIINVDNCYFKNVNEVFNQMYATSEDDAYWGFVKATDCKFEGKTGKSNSDGFDVRKYYDYEFAMDDAADVPSLLDKMGCVEGLESDIIPFPGDGAIGVLQDTKLACGDIEGAESYTYKIGLATNFMHDYDPDTYTLKPGVTYYWQVTVNGGKYDGKQSPVFRFTTANSMASFPTPADGDKHAQLREITGASQPTEPVTLQWRDGFDATGYILYIGETEDLSDATPVELSSTGYRPGNLKHGKTYYWRVDTQRNNGATDTGVTWTFASDVRYAKAGRNEVEHAVRECLCFPEYDNSSAWIDASNDSCNVGDEGPGCMSFTWAGDDGIYDVTTAYFDENSGQGWFGVYVNEDKKDGWTATANNNKMATRTTKSVALNKGDELRIEFYTQKNMRCRTDYIDVAWVSGPSGITNVTASSPTQTRIYSLDGRYLGGDKMTLKKGIYIINGKKVVVR